jgi:hypothetical protein
VAKNVLHAVRSHDFNLPIVNNWLSGTLLSGVLYYFDVIIHDVSVALQHVTPPNVTIHSVTLLGLILNLEDNTKRIIFTTKFKLIKIPNVNLLSLAVPSKLFGKLNNF